MPAKPPVTSKPKAKSSPKSRAEEGVSINQAPEVVTPAPEPKVAEEQQISMDQYMDEVRQRAHEIYLERGDRPGTPLGDWLQAEREIKAKHNIKG